MNPLFWIYQLDLITLVPAAVIALGLTFTPMVRSLTHTEAVEPGKHRSDRVLSLALVFAALLAIATPVAAQLHSFIPWVRTFSPWARSGLEFLWFEFAPELLVGCGALFALTIALLCVRQPPRAAVPPSEPRNWRTYAPRPLVIGLVVTLGGFLLVTLFAGSISSPDQDGRYTMLEINSGGDFSAGSGIFYGWAYGIPTALVAFALVGITFVFLQLNATRPFMEPGTVTWETQSRRSISTRVLWFSVGILAYALGVLLLRMGFAAGGVMSTPEYEWRTSISALEPVLIWAGRSLRVVGWCLVFLVAFTRRPRPAKRNSDAGAGHLASSPDAAAGER
ncbi:MAG: hypothetical protein ACTIA6_10510 [Pseudoclavibacter sp.]